MGVGDGLGGEVEVVAEVLNTSVRESVVEPLPVEGLSDVVSRLEREHELHDVDVGDVDLSVCCSHVLGACNSTLTEEVSENGKAILSGDEHLGKCSNLPISAG